VQRDLQFEIVVSESMQSLRISETVTFADAARSEVAGDLVVCEFGSGHRVNRNLDADFIRIPAYRSAI
jgi:hypothetical protein